MVRLRPGYSESLLDIIERMLDKGIVIDTKIRISIDDIHLVKVRGTIILSSFSAAAKHGIDFPSEVIHETQAWRDLLTKVDCPQCNKMVAREELEEGCPWCGYDMGPS
ncbi:MAG: gas vesicle protein [Nanoarchaeota archaeon]|nr:gas vesicle protein [Nanoarchaeota archaeon]